MTLPSTKEIPLLAKFDFYAPSIKHTLNGKQYHKTKCGGFLSIVFYPMIFTLIVQNLWTLFAKENDKY